MTFYQRIINDVIEGHWREGTINIGPFTNHVCNSKAPIIYIADPREPDPPFPRPNLLVLNS